MFNNGTTIHGKTFLFALTLALFLTSTPILSATEIRPADPQTEPIELDPYGLRTEPIELDPYGLRTEPIELDPYGLS